MNKYLNIFNDNNRKECFVIDNDEPSRSYRIEVGESVRVLDQHKKLTLATLGFDTEKGEFFLEIDGKKNYSVQGTTVVI